MPPDGAISIDNEPVTIDALVPMVQSLAVQGIDERLYVRGGSFGSGGDAEVARYPTQVVSKLRRALRYPRGGGGAAGEVHVQFTVSSGGQPSGIRVVKSSGNAAIDQAGVDTVTRAAPFPPIPAGANRNIWAFTVPLAFVRG